MLPKFAEGGATVGVGATSTGHVYHLVSGNKKADAELIGIVNETLRNQGVLKGTVKSSRASDVEQKMAGLMIRDNVNKAEIVINNPAGPCSQPLGCHQTLNAMISGPMEARSDAQSGASVLPTRARR
ncbi:DddA-like double-stranded DNA deaminase toxin [Streptomyces sp. JV178]|uniref:DddA-like double-stranded DNA deaminase toxin n=1 Tax=Streptomyces sp. JV178 TaxID=858632 RepID=UPI0034D6EC78